VLVLYGESAWYDVTIQKISRQGSQVTVEATFPHPTLGGITSGVTGSAYHLVAVSKDGTWNQNIHFILMMDGEMVDETTAFVP
jgi:hypothetical protein